MRTPETSREFDARWDSLTLDEADLELRRRNKLADDLLRPMLVKGDKIRATKAECGSSESTFIFDHWDRGWIQSKGGNTISPWSVYSVNGVIFRV
jgi:hypothetical protein